MVFHYKQSEIGKCRKALRRTRNSTVSLKGEEGMSCDDALRNAMKFRISVCWSQTSESENHPGMQKNISIFVINSKENRNTNKKKQQLLVPSDGGELINRTLQEHHVLHLIKDITHNDLI